MSCLSSAVLFRVLLCPHSKAQGVTAALFAPTWVRLNAAQYPAVYYRLGSVVWCYFATAPPELGNLPFLSPP